MAITLPVPVTERIIKLALEGQDHRIAAIDIIDTEFLAEATNFFKTIVQAKLDDEGISEDWYAKYFLDGSKHASRDLLWHGGLNRKTVTNARRSATKAIVLEEAIDHYERFVEMVDGLIDEELEVDLAITFRGVTVNLNLSESLIVINALAVLRATIRGGVWSSVGKQVEAPLMEVLCRMYDVAKQNYDRRITGDTARREADFYLLPEGNSHARCEVKLMGQGNPESIDAAIARGSKVIVASTLSDLDKAELDSHGILWTELQTVEGFRRFSRTLDTAGIPYVPIPETANSGELIDAAILEVFRDY